MILHSFSAYPTRHKLLTSCAVTALTLGVMCNASGAKALDVITSVKRDYARIFFQWDVPTDIESSATGNELTITMDEPRTIPLSEIERKLSPYILNAQQGDDGRQVVLTMRDAYPIRSFVSGGNNGVDVLFNASPRPEQVIDTRTDAAKRDEPDASIMTTKSAQELAKAEKEQQEKPVLSTKTQASVEETPTLTTKEPETPDTKEQSTKEQSKTKPAATQAATSQSMPTTKPKPQSLSKSKPKPEQEQEQEQAEPEPQVLSEADVDALLRKESKWRDDATSKQVSTPDTDKATQSEKITRATPEEQTTPQPDKPDEANASSSGPVTKQAQVETGKPTEAAQEKQAGSAREMVVSVQTGRIGSRFFFPFNERTAAASFTQGRETFVIFDSKDDVNVDLLTSVLPPYVSDVEQIPHEQALILRMTGASNPLHSRMKRTEKGYEWALELSRRPQIPGEVTVPEAESQPPVTPHVMLNLLQTAEVIDFTHPVTGQRLSVIPTHDDNHGVYPQRVFPEVVVLQTGQGGAFIARDEDVRMIALRQGVRITKPGGLTISPDLAELPPQEQMIADAAQHTFYPYEDWKVEDPNALLERERRLIQQISEADAEEKPAKRLELVQLYMGEGLHREAQAQLELIRETAPDFYEIYQLPALAGAANVMSNRMAEAREDFAHDALEGEEEVALWNRLLDIVSGEQRALDYFSANKQFIQRYPPDMRRRIGLLAADNALSQRKFNTVLTILDQMEQDELMDPVEDYGNYMVGRIYAETGNLEEAEETLRPLIEDVDDRLIRARSAFTLATAKYKAGVIDRPELIGELEGLRHVWRGDAFELNLLNLLGELYINNEQYLYGLRAWREVVSHFPDTMTAQDASKQMAQVFIDLFNEGEADEMTPLSALALYFEFRELTPLGQQGDVMVQNLADRLAGVDLLDRAASLLEHQVTFRLESKERSRVGARLALLHLLNRKPEKSLEVLELTGYGENDEPLRRDRNHLAAMSYMRMGEWDEALNILRNDYSREAKFLRSDIFWQKKDWDNLALTVEDILQTRQDVSAPLDKKESRSVIRLGIAYTFTDEPQQLQYLRDYFLPLMSNEKKRNMLDFVTAGIDPVNRDTIAQLNKEIGQMESFLDNYELTMEEKGLGSVN